MENNKLFELIKDAREDENSMVLILDKFSPVIKSQARQLKNDCAETDLIIFLIEFVRKLNIEKLKSYSEGEIINYISMSIKNKKIDMYRKECKLLEEIHSDYSIENDKDPFDLSESVCIKDMLNKLKKEHKEVIELKYINGLSDIEISILLGISRQAVCKRKNKALEILRKEVL